MGSRELVMTKLSDKYFYFIDTFHVGTFYSYIYFNSFLFLSQYGKFGHLN